MNPEKIKKLLEIPDFNDFAAYVASCANDLKTLPTVEGKDDRQIAIEVISQEKAFAILVNILDPILNPPQGPSPSRNKEFEM